MIVKVQLSLATNVGQRQVLVYNQSRTVRYEGSASPELIEAMAGRTKAFFATTGWDNQYLNIDFYNPLPDQGW